MVINYPNIPAAVARDYRLEHWTPESLGTEILASKHHVFDGYLRALPHYVLSEFPDHLLPRITHRMNALLREFGIEIPLFDSGSKLTSDCVLRNWS